MLLHSLIVVLSFLAISSLAAPIPDLERRATQPAIARNFPDPSFIHVGDYYYAYSTQSGGKHVPIARSSDFTTWTMLEHDALPKVGAWSTGKAVWAPHVVQLADGTFVMYYSDTSASYTTSHCIGAATSKTAAGPFVAQDDVLVCPASQGGAIDPSGFQDVDGKQYVVYKIDGNNIGHGGSCGNEVAPIIPTPIMVQEVSSSNGYDLIGSPRQILDRDENDGPLVEAPSLVRVQSSLAASGWMYILFFSSNCYASGKYDTKYATSIKGIFNDGQDYHKADAALMQTGSPGGSPTTDGKFYSPGGMQVGTDGARAVFHADLGYSHTVRQMWKADLIVIGREVSV